ncbi:unnamed protein product [Staurois parvus]|uniref:XK-related protein n=1 Tax=Staurois parvus TaxID=386267 RepID=A0ABN9B8K9_9NEOB|nr:unnamed protein product [Staurois parvus]
MPSCLAPRYRLLDLVFAVLGTVAFLWDLGIDIWSAVKYYKGGDPVFAGLHFGLYVVSSLVLQLLSWGWFRADWKDWAGIRRQPFCLSILHILQLGYPFRCLHSLEVGIAAYRSSESSPEFSPYQEYAYFLTHDISMMRLVETFLENTPQLILVLYVIIQQETIHLFQYFSIAISFICISWAILDYHQSLRLFLKDKEKLNLFSSVIYFLWNLFLISSRIICITLFVVTFHWMIAVHFVAVCFVFFLWACLQKTEFMKNKFLEPFYRATVAVILYFSWFNIADGKTVYRCLFYHIFITLDSMILLLSWTFLRFPSIMDKYEILIIVTAALLTGLGLMTRLFYYKCVHPNVTRETKEYYDELDGIIGEGTYRMFEPT